MLAINLFFQALTLSISLCQIFPGNSVIDNSHWLDTSGNFIHAHGGQIFLRGSTFYWIGTTQKQKNSQNEWLSEGINCYSSRNLMDWTFVNRIFSNTSIVLQDKDNIARPYRIERPKVLYAPDGRYKLWFKLNSMIGIARSHSLCGAVGSNNFSYQFIDAFEPDGFPVNDCNLFQDTRQPFQFGTAYFIRNVNNSFVAISGLNSSPPGTDWQNTTGIISKGPHIDAPAIFLLSTFYLLGSHHSNIEWKPNMQELCVTNNALTLTNAVWNFNLKSCPNPKSSVTTYQSQSTFVLRLIQGPDGTNNFGNYVFMYMGDIWNYPNIATATYKWLPFVFKNNNPKSFPFIPDLEQWTISNYTIPVPH